MQFGTPATFAIDCVHEPIPNATGQVFGRMCIWAGGAQLGDFNEPACMLNVTGAHLEQVLARLGTLGRSELDNLSDVALYQFLDCALYADDGRTNSEVSADADKYFRYDFLTNGGESFDRFKSFIVPAAEELRVLFSEFGHEPLTARVNKRLFERTVTEFLGWLSAEARNDG